MDVSPLKVQRKSLRISFSACANKIEQECKKDTPDINTLETLRSQLTDKFGRLECCQEQITSILLSDEKSEENVFQEDFESAESYRDRYCELCSQIDRISSKLPSTEECCEKRKFKLPQIELKKFSGDAKEFLTFWSQFEKIHVDQSIPDSDKFQYLLQAVIPKSKAARVVESFPATAENYPKAVAQLRERFGREDLLVQIYVRDLLTLVMKNAATGRAKTDLPALYDELEAKIRALESLGRTQEKYGDFLSPLVESCLPADILMAWERNKNYKEASQSEDRSLQNLMNFLKQEVKSEEMVQLARSGFGASSIPKKYTDQSSNSPTTAALVSFSDKNNAGLLYGSLRTFQAHACDGSELRLNCTQNTVISLNFVSYGREAGRGDLCPGPGTYDAPTCRLENALTVIERKCRGQVLCRMLLTPELFLDDPCPGVRKYAEVAYKCKPESFKNKIFCEGERMFLNCPEGQSLSIYSASFGTTRSEVPECGQEDAVQTDDCQVSYASEILMKLCNGLQRCTLVANSATFGDRKCTGRKHLKVTYNCVQKEVLIRPASPDKTSNEETIHTTSFPGWARGYDPPQLNNMQRHNDHRVRTSTLPSNSFRSEMQSDEVPLDGSRLEQLSEDQKIVGFMSQLMSAHKYMRGNKEKLILYVALTTGLGFLLFGTVLVARFLVTHVKSRRNSKVDVLPVSDDQFFSDSDLEQFDPLDVPPPPVINYTASLRRQSSSAQPRAPVADGTELNHYFS